jgi:hypothetical protein
MKTLFNLTLLILLLSRPLNAQDASLWFDGIEIRPGMTKPEVLQRLRQRFRVDQQDGPDSDIDMWCIDDRQAPPSSCGVGMLQFASGKLLQIQKDLGGIVGDDVASLFGQIFQALAGSSAPASTSFAVIETQEYETNQHVRERRLTLSLPDGRDLEIGISEPIGSLSVTHSQVHLGLRAVAPMRPTPANRPSPVTPKKK